MVTDTNTKAAYDKAQARAREMGGASRVMPLGHNKYSVLSSGGDKIYTVTVVEREHQEIFICTCLAGVHGKLCKHKVWVFKVRTMAQMHRATVTAPAYVRGQAAKELWG